MTAPALAVSGSCCTDDWPFSAAVRGPRGVELAVPHDGERGDLAVLVQRACAAAKVAVGELREVRVDHGPGSYVGLRVAVTLARCLCAFGQARLCAVDSLALIAAAALASGAPAGPRLRPVVDARRGRVHASTLVLLPAGVLRAESPPAVLPLPDFARSLLPDDVVIAPRGLAAALAPGAARARAVVRAAGPAHAGHLFAAALPVREFGLDELEPLYLMGAYAE